MISGASVIVSLTLVVDSSMRELCMIGEVYEFSVSLDAP